MIPTLRHRFAAFAWGATLAVGLTACGPVDDSGDAASGDAVGVGSLANVSGTVRGISGSASEMAGWAVAFVERDTGVAKVAEVGPVGNFIIVGLAMDRPHTVVLLDPNYRLSSVLVQPSPVAGQLLQYFTAREKILPTLVQKGPVASFSDSRGITWEKDYCLDANGDGIPDGLVQQSLATRLSAGNPGGMALAGAEAGGDDGFALQQKSSNVDSDNDGKKNDVDPDIDGDGIPNGFDADIDGDGVFNIFDADANGDGVLDSAQAGNELTYKLGFEYAFLQVIQQSRADGSLATSLQFVGKVRPDFQNAAVGVRAPPSLIQGAMAQVANLETGVVTSTGWDRSLADDGANGDGLAKDGIFGRNVQLADGKDVRANQVLFVELAKRFGPDNVIFSFPYVIPGISTGAVGATYNAASRVFTRTGSAFIGIKDFRWSVNVYDAANKKVFSSEPILGTAGTYTMPPHILEAGQKYTAIVYAQSLDRITNYPAWIIKSLPIALN